MAKFHVDLMLLEGGSIMYLIVLFGQKGDQKEVGLWKQIFRFFFFFFFFYSCSLHCFVYSSKTSRKSSQPLSGTWKRKKETGQTLIFLSKAALIYGIKINLKNAS